MTQTNKPDIIPVMITKFQYPLRINKDFYALLNEEKSKTGKSINRIIEDLLKKHFKIN